AGVAFNHLVELVAPWLLVGPRRVRHLAGILLAALQCTLILSGNLSFLNWLTLVPIVACFDDMFWRRVLPAWLVRYADARSAAPVPQRNRFLSYAPSAALVAVVGWLSIPVVENLVSNQQAMNRSYDAWHLVNTYGAFGSVGSSRYEL